MSVDLIARLRDGVRVAETTSSGGELYDIDAAETVMSEAADYISEAARAMTALSQQREIAYADREALEVECVTLRSALADIVGLIQLISSRNDLPEGLRDLKSNHRYIAAVEASQP